MNPLRICTFLCCSFEPSWELRYHTLINNQGECMHRLLWQKWYRNETKEKIQRWRHRASMYSSAPLTDHCGTTIIKRYIKQKCSYVSSSFVSETCIRVISTYLPIYYFIYVYSYLFYVLKSSTNICLLKDVLYTRISVYLWFMLIDWWRSRIVRCDQRGTDTQKYTVIVINVIHQISYHYIRHTEIYNH